MNSTRRGIIRKIATSRQPGRRVIKAILISKYKRLRNSYRIRVIFVFMS
jgi:hypothetical protein